MLKPQHSLLISTLGKGGQSVTTCNIRAQTDCHERLSDACHRHNDEHWHNNHRIFGIRAISVDCYLEGEKRLYHRTGLKL